MEALVQLVVVNVKLVKISKEHQSQSQHAESPKVQVPEQVGVLSDSERKEGSKIRKGGKTSMRDDDEAEF